jgi:hypothetical protein
MNNYGTVCELGMESLEALIIGIRTVSGRFQCFGHRNYQWLIMQYTPDALENKETINLSVPTNN